ncbi:hypothetical protein [Pseudoroseomonas ludipueritiae]|uniref:Holin-X, holin superfamily III n=1 Tax=Pseudoroseomonas ludipueritiae TaxID=198093 RepID=A0ABR7RAE5_9PROT|nr:hypothetical protein [Pseudoroseomonas ludipueritiae]MBC9178380.1 hypothetical protein [Pseudoroseomonas ludipueritiae]MCG7362558.1 hypothetical protein [Roseomonas sp. ACRSG]
MRSLRLLNVAWEAERTRLGLRVQREVRRVILLLAAAVMAGAAFAMLHLVAWIAIGDALSPLWKAIVIFAADIVLALVLAMVAMRNPPSTAELEAASIRRTALHEARNGIGVSLLPLAFTFLRSRRAKRRERY